MKQMRKLFTILLLVGITGGSLSAQVFNPFRGCVTDPNGDCIPNSVLSVMPFLRIIPDARGGAMGDAGIAVAPDPNSMHYNSSNLAFIEKDMSFSATYTPWLRELNLNDIYLAYLSGYKKIDDLQTVGFAMRYFSLGDINFTDEQGIEIGAGRPRELEFAASYARKLSDNFAMGLTGKYVYSNLASGQEIGGQDIQSASSFAADLSFTYRKENNIGANGGEFAFGMAFTNIGAKVTYTDNTVRDFLPSNLGIGTALTMNLDEFNSLTFALDFNKLLIPSPISPSILPDDDPNGVPQPNPLFDPNNNGIGDYREKSLFGGIFGSFSDAQGGFSEEIREVSVSFGAEYWYDKQFAVRTGYYYENPLKGNRQFLTVGLGLKYNVFGFDLSYLVPTNNVRNPLDNTLRFTLHFDFEALQGLPIEEN
jgi:hypothetical protein